MALPQQMIAQPDTRPIPATPPPLGRPLPAWPESKPDMLMRLIGAMMFTYIWRVQDAFPVLNKIPLPTVFAILALIVYVVSGFRHPWRRAEQLRMPLTSLMIALLAIMLLGVPTSLWRGHSFMFTIKLFIPNLIFMGLVAASIRSTRDIEWYVKMNLYGAIFYATIVNLFFHVGSDGRLGDLVFYDANDFALITVCSIPFAVYVLRRGRGFRPGLGLLALSMFGVGVVKSGSRGGFIGFIAVTLYVLLCYRAIPSRVRLFAGLAGVGLILGLGSDKYWSMMRTILHPQSDYNWNANDGRIEIWKRGMHYMMTHPVLGIGVQAFPVAEGTLSEISHELTSVGKGFKWSVAHNSFIETGAELGIPGLIVFCMMFVVAIRMLARIVPRAASALWVTSREMALAQLLIGAFVGFVVAGFFVSAEYFSYLYFLFGLAVGVNKLVRLRRIAVISFMVSQRGMPLPAPARPVKMRGAMPFPRPRAS